MEEFFNPYEIKKDFISLNEICRANNWSVQYVSRYLIPKNFERRDPDYPFLGEGIKIEGDVYDWFSISVPRSDAEELIRRIKKQKEKGL